MPIALFALAVGAFSIGLTEFVIAGICHKSQQVASVSRRRNDGDVIRAGRIY